MIRLNTLILVFFLVLIKSSFGQDNYRKWLQQQNKEYNQFISEQDKQFVEFLKKEWVIVKVEKGVKAFSKPKPLEPIIYLPWQKPKTSIMLFSIKEHPIKTNDKGTQSKIENEKLKETINLLSQNERNEKGSNNDAPSKSESIAKSFIHQLNYYDSELSVIYNESLDVPFGGEINHKAIADYWEKLSGTNYVAALKRAVELKDKMRLNGWGYCELLYDIASQLTQGNRNESYLLTWFMLAKSSYLAKVGYEKDKIYLLVSTDDQLFDTPFFRFKNLTDRYYVVIFNGDEKEPTGLIATYKDDYPMKSEKVSLGFRSVPGIGNIIVKKEINFDYMGKKYLIPFEYNKNLIDFYKNYPNTDLKVYFHSCFSDAAQTTILPVLKNLIKGLKEQEAVNFLLHFVQKATKYETDQEQFGREKSFFPEETLYYPYSDCEDRAIFFSYLVRNLIGLKVIGLSYPEHVSTAVKFTTNVTGDYINYNNTKYIICDPTYIGASIGQCMPQFKNVTAEIIEN